MPKLKMIAQVEGPVLNRLRRGNMDELIGQPAVKAGIDRSVAEKTIGNVADSVIPKFQRSDGSVSAELMRSALIRPALMRSRLISSGFAGLGMLGLGMVGIQTLARELLRFGCDKPGADQMGEIIAGTLG